MSRASAVRFVSAADAQAVGLTALGDLRRGARGHVIQVGCGLAGCAPGTDAEELERRLLEIGFVEGASFEIVHEGLIGHDPIAIKLDDLTVALRRKEAVAVLVRLEADEAEFDLPGATDMKAEAAA